MILNSIRSGGMGSLLSLLMITLPVSVSYADSYLGGGDGTGGDRSISDPELQRALLHRVDLERPDVVAPHPEEQAQLQMTTPGYAVWLRTKRVLAAAQIAAMGNDFAGGANPEIRFDTPLRELVPPSGWNAFLTAIRVFASAEFQQPMGTPVNRDILQSGATAAYLFEYVDFAMQG